MKKVILVFNNEKVELLKNLGFASCGVRDIGGGKTVFQFIMTDKLHGTLKDKSLFSRKDYCEDSRLTF